MWPTQTGLHLHRITVYHQLYHQHSIDIYDWDIHLFMRRNYVCVFAHTHTTIFNWTEYCSWTYVHEQCRQFSSYTGTHQLSKNIHMTFELCQRIPQALWNWPVQIENSISWNTHWVFYLKNSQSCETINRDRPHGVKKIRNSFKTGSTTQKVVYCDRTAILNAIYIA